MQLEPGSPEMWLRYARSDLALAQQPPSPEVLWETLCFHTQQAAEKAIKAVLVHEGVGFPRTHSIERLIDLLPAAISRTPELLAADRLTVYATVLRYPTGHEVASEERFRDALGLAEAVVMWAEQVVLG